MNKNYLISGGKNMKRLFCFPGLFLILSSFCFMVIEAEEPSDTTAVIYGLVYDDVPSNPLQNATVYFVRYDSLHNVIHLDSSITDTSGVFSAVIVKGTYDFWPDRE